MSSETTADAPQPSGGPPPEFGNPYPWHAPRFWHGMRFGDWLGLMAEGGFRVSPSRLPLALPLLAITPFNSLLAWVQQLFYGRRIAAAKLSEPPIFVIGHFRSGTTHLYELLARAPNLSAPTSFDCFAPSHFVLTRSWLPRLLRGLAPQTRPMDRMAFGFERPQEDEFALLALGAPTIYRRLAFPGQRTPAMASLDGEGLSSGDRRRLHRKLAYFLGAQSLVQKNRLVVKSPVHTGRLRMLLEMFPGAKFVHITRDPRAMFVSLRHTWRVLELTQAFQAQAADADRDEMMFAAFERMYVGFRRDRPLLGAHQLCEVRYDDLVAEPQAQLKRIYEELDLPGFEVAQPKFAEYLATLGDYHRNAFSVDAATAAAVDVRCQWYLREYGYEGNVPD